MPASLRWRFWVELVLASVTAGVAVVTLLSREWIELVFRVDPDNGDGSLEWVVVVLALTATFTFAALARAEWRHAVDAIAGQGSELAAPPRP